MDEGWICERLAHFDELNAGFRRIYELSRNLKNPINLVVGQPHFDVPEPIKEAAITAIRQGHNSYAPTQGFTPLLEVIRADVRKRCNDPDRDVIITGGANAALNLALLAALNPGDEVIIFDPTFMAYEPMIRLFGGVPVLVDIYPTFVIDPERVRAALTPRTKAMIICTPDNPTGVVQPPAVAQALARLAHERNLLLVCDEIYSTFVYDVPFTSPAAFNPDVVVCTSFSKTHSMCGWRLGFAHGPKRIIDAMTRVQLVTYVAGPNFAQHAALVAWNYDMSAYRNDYQRKRDRFLAGLDKNHYDVVKPGGAFYFFVPAPWGTSNQFVEACLRENLMVLPGTIFGRRDTHFRVSYAATDATLDKGLEVLNRLKRP
jgi:aspartate/methionine/tyrosine aminotransferase